MKRFYTDVAVVTEEGGFAVRLDGRPVRTPGRAPLVLPSAALAEAVAEEWRAQGEEIDPRAMLFTGLANAALDPVSAETAAFASDVARYGESDLLCYRADSPAALVDRQAAAWDPLLEWAARRYDIGWRPTAGIIHVAQPPETLARLGQAVSALSPFALAALSTLVNLSGSLVIGLAVVERAFDPEKLWDAAQVDEAWQAEQWGEDALAAQRDAARRAEFLAAARFVSLI